MKYIYLICGYIEWEGHSHVKAYADEMQAQVFCAACNEHETKYPQPPEHVESLDDELSETEQQKWDMHTENVKQWSLAHPANLTEDADFTHRDEYGVEAIQLEEAL